MTDYCPGAVQVPQSGGVTLDTSLPPRAVWHITWDALNAAGGQPAFGAVAGYLQREGYCPHLMWNPFTGYIEQYYPASQGSRALMYNDQDGAACVQIEVFFTPGCVVNGVKYETVADTPLVGFDMILEWLDSLGVPRVWPMGAPQWTGNSRDANVWNANAGHYGHCNSPGDTHTDPGPMPDLNRGTINPHSTPTVKDWLDMATQDEVKAALSELLDEKRPDAEGIPTSLRDLVYISRAMVHDVPNQVMKLPVARGGQNVSGNSSLAGVVAYFDQSRTDLQNTIPGAVLNAQFKLADGTVTNLAGILSAINAKPVTVTNVSNAPAAPFDVDAFVARLKAELPAAIRADLAAKLTN